ncbi:MAG: imidazole glycerol phosphate synthase subunit HisH [Flavobacteriales bacterium AspAUS03]
MKIAIIKYPAGNVQSVCFALERLGITAKITDDAETIQTTDKVIFPGVGEARSAMKDLHQKGLDRLIPMLKQPVLGICLGLHLLCQHSEENDTNCLGIFDLAVKKFQASVEKPDKIPQIGWNTINQFKGSLFEGIPEDSYQYFVHSYYAPLGVHTVAQAEYTLTYSAALQKDNFYAVQFHPEKSAEIGQQILENFIQLKNPKQTWTSSQP